ncbi:MAG TPA: hypothetical protein VGU64_05335, partial [Terriglobales bacterium]|nr:hypothetical protein [Terriglobales bacterium]
PLWWSLVPYVFFGAVKPEDGIDYVANWSVKSCVLLLGISMIFPAFRQALFSKTVEQPSEPLGDEIAAEEPSLPEGVVIPR